MIIIEKNEGPKIPYSIQGNFLFLGDSIAINPANYQHDEDMTYDICYDKYGDLVMGAEGSESYVAQLDIPGVVYDYVENGTDENGNPKYDKVPQPFSMDDITLTLWSIGGEN